MKPDWKDAPEWARWLAQDGNGVWFWYSTKPKVIQGDDRWSYGGTYKRAYVDTKGWKKSLERRP